MSAETFTTAIFLITAVIAAGVLVNAVLPVVYTMAGTFSSSTHDSDERLRTDFKIVTYHYAYSATNANSADIWMKNIGSSRIAETEIISQSDVFFGPEDNYARLSYAEFIDDAHPPSAGSWTTDFLTDSSYDVNTNNYWDPGETLHIIAHPKISIFTGDIAYFQFILPGGSWRSQTFTAS